MPGKVTVYDLLISCPSDVSEFIPSIEHSVHRFNIVYGRDAKIVVRPLYYQEACYSEMGDHPQKLVNKQYADEADFAISVFWSKFGTPTEYYGSGTEEEVENMCKAGKQVFLYFLDKPLPPSKMDPEQTKRLNAFKERHKMDGLYYTVSDEQTLCNLFCDQLKLYFNRIQYAKQLSSGQKKCILWVDDRPENNVYERRMLEEYGVEVLIALSTKQALDLLNSNRSISLIISDMGRKEGPQEGYVLLEAVRKKNEKIPVYLFVGSNAPHHIAEAKLRGAQGCTNSSYELLDYVIKELLK